MQDYEQLGAFYLGRRYDTTAGRATDELLLYDAKDLTTHAVCVGMTGSGKTGLCLSLLEEAAIDGIPAIAIDPKGDLGNLLLTYPQLRPADFRPWVDESEAARQGISADDLAAKTAEKWRAGLAEWGQDPERIARFRESADVAIYTPGSNAGLPLTVLRSFAAPPPAVLADAEALRERVAGAAAGLLALLGIEADPLRSREQILLANLFDAAWKESRGLDIGGLIREIQSPPFDKVGVIDLESFFPAKERFELAMRLNNLLASPGFSTWMEGEPLDVARLLHTPQGKPRLSIISIAHLSDAERMFFVTILLGEVLTWMRGQSGTGSLRALLYMDEVFGYFPPTANPPSKTPLLTLLKQARAFGLGVVLATQNPVDLDYKGLSNAGTWFLGRLQTERDKLRVLEGLEGASAAGGAAFDRPRMERLLAGLDSRVFLMHNVHEDEAVVFQTRWALSYLRGPLTRDQIATLMRERKGQSAESRSPASASAEEVQATPGVAPNAGAQSASRPVLPPGIDEVFLHAGDASTAGKSAPPVYRPAVLGIAKVHFAQASLDVDAEQAVTLLCEVEDSLPDDVWEQAEELVAAPGIANAPPASATFAPLPADLAGAKAYKSLAASLKEHLYRTRRLSVWKCPALKQASRPGESEGEFRVRLTQAAHERRDEQLEALRGRYAPKLAALEERLRKAEQRVEKERSQASEKSWQAAITLGSSVLGALFGRKKLSGANVGRAASSMRAAGRAAGERADIGQAEETVAAVRERLAELDAEFQQQTAELRQACSPEALSLEETQVKPKKADITIVRVALAWRPG